MARQERKLPVGRVRPAFTLVELLVVITIIGMLMALLMPAISAARESARRTQCVDNQHQIAIAMQSYESTKRAYPGWRNMLTTSSGTVVVPWPTMLLPYMDRADLWQNIKTLGATAISGTSATALKLLVCPSDPVAVQGTAQSAYVANGLVLRDPVQTTPAPLAPLTMDYISGADGTATTLLLSEITQIPPAPAITTPNSALYKGHCWFDLGPTLLVGQNSNPITPVLLAQTFGFAVTGVPPYSQALVTFATPYGTQISYYNNNFMTANINSNHSGGVIAAFCDGHTTFLRDDAGLNMATGSSVVSVYQILVTPDGSKLNPLTSSNPNGEPPADESQW